MKTINEQWDFAQGGYTHVDKRTSTEWKFKVSDRVLYICFQGSTSFIDWLQNFFFLPRWSCPYKNTIKKWFTHAGFKLKWKAVEDDVKKVIVATKPEWDSIRIIGHSQGGAIATLANECIAYQFPNTAVSTVTFGAPRSLFFFNLKHIKDRFKNVVNYITPNDIVTKLPLWIMGYRCVGTTIVVSKRKFLWPPSEIIAEHLSYGEYDYSSL